jgi:hypothetical protein
MNHFDVFQNDHRSFRNFFAVWRLCCRKASGIVYLLTWLNKGILDLRFHILDSEVCNFGTEPLLYTCLPQAVITEWFRSAAASRGNLDALDLCLNFRIASYQPTSSCNQLFEGAISMGVRKTGVFGSNVINVRNDKNLIALLEADQAAIKCDQNLHSGIFVDSCKWHNEKRLVMHKKKAPSGTGYIKMRLLKPAVLDGKATCNQVLFTGVLKKFCDANRLNADPVELANYNESLLQKSTHLSLYKSIFHIAVKRKLIEKQFHGNVSKQYVERAQQYFWANADDQFQSSVDAFEHMRSYTSEMTIIKSLKLRWAGVGEMFSFYTFVTYDSFYDITVGGEGSIPYKKVKEIKTMKGSNDYKAAVLCTQRLSLHGLMGSRMTRSQRTDAAHRLHGKIETGGGLFRTEDASITVKKVSDRRELIEYQEEGGWGYKARTKRYSVDIKEERNFKKSAILTLFILSRLPGTTHKDGVRPKGKVSINKRRDIKLQIRKAVKGNKIKKKLDAVRLSQTESRRCSAILETEVDNFIEYRKGAEIRSKIVSMIKNRNIKNQEHEIDLKDDEINRKEKHLPVWKRSNFKTYSKKLAASLKTKRAARDKSKTKDENQYLTYLDKVSNHELPYRSDFVHSIK